MTLFKKLNEQINVINTKNTNVSLSEREEVETALIFGNIYENINSIINENGDAMQYFQDTYQPWLSELSKKLQSGEVTKEEAIAQVKAKTSGHPEDERAILGKLKLSSIEESLEMGQDLEAMYGEALKKTDEDEDEENKEE